MRLVTGRGSSRTVVELPCVAIRSRDERQHQALIENLIERICPRDAAYIGLNKRGVRVYNH